MSAGETRLLDVAFDNLEQVNFQPFQVVDIDPSSTIHSSGVVLAGNTSGGTAVDTIGVVYDMAKLQPNGTPVASSGVAVRCQGIARVVASAGLPITPGPGVYATPVTGASTSTSLGTVTTASPTASWQNKPSLGRVLTAASTAGDQILVLLTPGSRF